MGHIKGDTRSLDYGSYIYIYVYIYIYFSHIYIGVLRLLWVLNLGVLINL